MGVDADILIVAATILSAFAFSSIVLGWVEQAMPWAALASMALGITLLAYVALTSPHGLTVHDIPNAFINVAAMIL